jgi:hypothetical protein
MPGLSCFSYLRRTKRDGTSRNVASAWVVMIAATCVVLTSLASCANADTTNISGFQGSSDDWVGTCAAQLAVGTPAGGVVDATLTVMCNQQPTVEETMSGPFVPGSGHYHAIVTAIKTAPDFSYDQDKNFDLNLAGNGCTMSGTVTDVDGSNNISFDSSAQGCPTDQ